MPNICDLCCKEADPRIEDCWQVVCVAPHAEDYYHEKCIQKFLRAMPGKNYDPSRRSGFPCPRGRGNITQFSTRCPGKVSHCQKVIVKANSRPGSASSAISSAAQKLQGAAAAAAPKAPVPKPAATAAAPKPPVAAAKPGKAPQNTWVPTKVAIEELQGPKPDPLGRNAAAAAAAACKAAKKNAKRAAAKQQKREQEQGEGSDESSSVADSSISFGIPGDSSNTQVLALPGAASGKVCEPYQGDTGLNGLQLDAEQLLLLQLLEEHKRKKQQPAVLTFLTTTVELELHQEDPPQQLLKPGPVAVPKQQQAAAMVAPQPAAHHQPPSPQQQNLQQEQPVMGELVSAPGVGPLPWAEAPLHTSTALHVEPHQASAFQAPMYAQPSLPPMPTGAGLMVVAQVQPEDNATDEELLALLLSG